MKTKILLTLTILLLVLVLSAFAPSPPQPIDPPPVKLQFRQTLQVTCERGNVVTYYKDNSKDGKATVYVTCVGSSNRESK